MKDWKQKATTLGRKLQKLREKYGEEKKYRKSLEGTIYSLQDHLEHQKQKSVLRINDIQQKYDELQLICRRSEETSESTKKGLEQTITALQREQEIKMVLIQKLELDVVDKTDQINSLQFQIRDLRIKWKSERCQQRMKNQDTQWEPQQYSLSSISTTKKVQSMESGIHSGDSEYQIFSHIDVESTEFDQEILSQSKQENDAPSSNVVDYKMLYKPGKTLKCVECDQLFEKHSEFVYHMAAQHDIKRPYRCSDCAKCYGTKVNLTQHIYDAHAPRYECGICHKGFGQKAHLKEHCAIHLEERPFKCLQCTSSFKGRDNLTNHIRMVHQKEKRFHCEHCSKGFFHKGGLIIHLRVHTGERPFQCTICGKAFSANAALTNHKRTHTGEKPYECSKCHKAFTRSDNMRRHEKKCNR